MKTTANLAPGTVVIISQHLNDIDGDPETHLSNYPGFEVGTKHVVQEIDAAYETAYIGTGIAVWAAEIELCQE